MGANIITVCCSLSYMLICSMCYVSIFLLCYVSLLSVCFVSIFSLCSVRFLVCVLFLFLVCVMCLCTLASLRSAGARFARCGRFAAAAAASRPPGTTVCLVAWLNPRDKGKRLSPQPGNRACLVAWLLSNRPANSHARMQTRYSPLLVGCLIYA